MTPSTTVTVDVHLTDADWQASLAADCAAGLLAVPKRLSPVWFYDARGSALFDGITRLSEYYPTRPSAPCSERTAPTSSPPPIPTRWSSWARGPRRRPACSSTP